MVAASTWAMLGKPSAFAIVIAALLFTTAARAEDEAKEEASDALQPRVERRWYGEQTLLADAASVGLMGLGAASDGASTRTAFLSAGLVSYAVAAPIVHAAHGHAGKAFGDLGMRIGLVGVGGVIGTAIALDAYEPPPNDGTPGAALGSAIGEAVVTPVVMLQGFLIGAAVGAVTATTLDASVLAREEVKKPGYVFRPSARTILPNVAPVREGFTAGLAGTF